MKFFGLIFSLTLLFSLSTLDNNTFAQRNDSALAKVMKSGAFLVDVRTPQEFAAGSVKGAINIPLDQIEQQISLFKGKKSVVVFCRSGNRSSQAKRILYL
jgi:phage shock protein E